MSDEETDEHVERAYDHMSRIDTHVPPGVPRASERVSTVEAHVQRYESAEEPAEQRDALDRAEDELAELRDAVEREVDEGRHAAREAIQDLEDRIDSLRQRI
ncbi:MAG: hypothetical protein ABEJ88_07970 [Halobacterium sp.]